MLMAFKAMRLKKRVQGLEGETGKEEWPEVWRKTRRLWSTEAGNKEPIYEGGETACIKHSLQLNARIHIAFATQ